MTDPKKDPKTETEEITFDDMTLDEIFTHFRTLENPNRDLLSDIISKKELERDPSQILEFKKFSKMIDKLINNSNIRFRTTNETSIPSIMTNTILDNRESSKDELKKIIEDNDLLPYSDREKMTRKEKINYYTNFYFTLIHEIITKIESSSETSS